MMSLSWVTKFKDFEQKENMIKNRYITAFLFCFTLFFLHPVLQAQQQGNEVLIQNIEAGDTYFEEGNKAEAARLYNQAAYLYRVEEKYQEAITYYKKVLEINTELGNKVGQMLTHSNLSMLYIETGNYQEALKHLEIELEFREKAKKIQEIIPVLVTIGGVYNELNNFDKAFEYINRAVQLSLEMNNMVLLKRSYGIAYDIYTKAGNSEEAQSYFEKYSAIDKKLKEERMAAVEQEAEQKVSVAYNEKAKTEVELEKTTQHLEEAERIAQQQKMELDLQQAQINEQNALLKIEKLQKKYFAIGFIVTLVFVIALGFLLIRIRAASKKINLQRFKLEKQNREIHSSIRYAKTIQTAMLPELSMVKDFGSYFVLYRPKDIVSGDFYWASSTSKDRMFFAVVDCTGHGVPGAFMSMIGIRILDEIINEMKLDSPAQILETLNEILRASLRQEQTDNNDGMDLALCMFDRNKDGSLNMVYSGAKRPAYIARNSSAEIEILNPDRKSIGGYQPAKRSVEFTNQKSTVYSGDTVYLFSDGIVDQNDQNRKKFGRARLEKLMKQVMNDSVDRQNKVFEKNLDEFMRGEIQRDDITLAGIKIN